jgi:tetratricopeptide (TPR) repeat protein
VLLSAAALQMLRNVERSEGIERRNLNALADSDWDALMARETSEVVEAAHRPTAGRASSNSRPPSSSATRPGTGANRAMPGARVASASLSGHPRKAGGAQLRAKRHSSGNVSLDTSAESMQSNPADGGGDAAALKAQGNEHYAQRRFLAAHRSYSLAMESDPANAVLLSNRAATHTMLLNYDACVRDCLRATSLDPKNWKAYSRMARAHAMLGQYPVAARHFTTALVLLEDSQRNGGPSSSAAAQAEVVKTERGELQHLERARLECDAANTQAAAGHYTKAASFVDEAPIRLLRLGCVLQFSPASARAELTKYLSTLDHPSTYATSDAASAVPSSGEGSAQSEALPLPPSSLMLLVPKLLLSKAQHYCAVLVTLAKASLYCGVHYLNIAASHLQQCIAIRADFPGAQAMLTQLTTFEDRLAAATELADAESHADAVTAFTEALDATHDTNTKVRGLVLVQRAESYLKVSMPKPAIEDCTVALSYDGNNVKALTKRARAHEALGDFRAALLDLEHAATINEELAEVVVALRMRMQQHQQQQQQQRQHQPSGSGGYFGGSRPGTGTGGRPGTGASYGQRPGTSQQSARPVATHYATLGVCAEADSGTIRTAYRKLTLQLHPDKLVKEADEVRQRCELRFKEVSHAYSVLSDPVQRMQYDLSLP